VKPHTIHKKVACITDQDPARKLVGTDDSARKCYPFEVNQDPAYEYSSHASALLVQYNTHASIRFFSQDTDYGKTLEYQLMFANPGCQLLVTESTINQDELAKLFEAYTQGRDIAYVTANKLMIKSSENERILASLTGCKGAAWDEVSKMKALLAARYLNSLGKGGNALELADKLEKNLIAKTPLPFTVPDYLANAINWTCL
jgi:hypothetical protein